MIDLTGYTGPDGFASRLCVLNEVTQATLTASVNTAGAIAVRSPLTYSTYSPGLIPVAPIYVTAEFTSAKPLDYVSLLVAEGGGATYTLQGWTGVAWVQVGSSMLVEEGKADLLLWLFDQVSYSKIRIRVELATDEPYLSVLKAGLETVLPQCLQPGWSPSWLNPKDDYTNVFSQEGQILSSQLLSAQIEEKLDLQNLQPSWVRDNWPTLRDAFRREGIVFAWRPSVYPTEVAYGMIEGTPQVVYQTHQRMSLSITLRGPAL